jgi:transposase InsO family protein
MSTSRSSAGSACAGPATASPPTGAARTSGARSAAGAGQVTGWEFVHVMVDDHSRLAYAEVFQGKGENARQAVAFLRRGLACFKAHGVEVERVMSDNGSGYVSRAHAIACRALGVRHTRIRPGRPRTNGKAERFIQTLLNECAYVRLYASSAERERQLTPYLERYNLRRPHGSLAKRPPASRLTNLSGNYT